MTKNTTLAILGCLLATLAIWAIQGGADPVVDDAQRQAEAESESAPGLSNDMTLATEAAPGAPAQVEPELAARENVIVAQEHSTHFDVDFKVVDESGLPVGGIKLKIFYKGGAATRWTSDEGEFSLYSILPGALWIASQGHEVLYPTEETPAIISADTELSVVLGSGLAIHGQVLSDFPDIAEVRLYKKVITDEEGRSRARWNPLLVTGAGEELEIQSRMQSNERLLAALSGSDPVVDPESIPQVAEYSAVGPLVGSLSDIKCPGKFKFSGLAAGSYRLVVDSKDHKKKSIAVEVQSRSTYQIVDISTGYKAIFDVRYQSGKIPGELLVRLVSGYTLTSQGTTRTADNYTRDGRWTFELVEKGKWYLEVRPWLQTMGRMYPVMLPSANPDSPVLSIVLEEPSETTVSIRFRGEDDSPARNWAPYRAVLRQPTNEYLGKRNWLPQEITEEPGGGMLKVALGLLFPGEYDLYLYPEPPRYSTQEEWVAPFAAEKLRISIPAGGEPTKIHVELDWLATQD